MIGINENVMKRETSRGVGVFPGNVYFINRLDEYVAVEPILGIDDLRIKLD